MLGQTGLVQIYTGNGKGKTTAALGLALRAAGHGAKVAIIQFMKGWGRYGELASLRALPQITLIQTGRPDYVYKGSETEADFKEAERGIALAEKLAADGGADLLILDEINVAMDYGLIPAGRVAALIKNKHENTELLLTGRNAPKELLDAADLITEMREIKHPFAKGITSREGVDF